MGVLQTVLDTRWGKVKTTLKPMGVALIGGRAPFTPHFSETDDPFGHELVTRAMLDAAVAAAVEPLGTTLRLLAQSIQSLEIETDTKASVLQHSAVQWRAVVCSAGTGLC